MEILKMKINIGCGKNYLPESWINCDITKKVKADYYFDAGKDKWPFKDNVFNGGKAEMVFEHLPDSAARIHFLKEFHRVCKNNAEILITVPHFSCHGAWQDLTHIRPFGSMSMDYVSINKTNKHSIMHDQEIEGNNQLFYTEPWIIFGKVYKKTFILNWIANNWHTRPIYEFFLAYIFPCRELHFRLKVVK